MPTRTACAAAVLGLMVSFIGTQASGQVPSSDSPNRTAPWPTTGLFETPPPPVQRDRQPIGRGSDRPDVLQDWLAEAETLREVLDNPRWHDTREWLREFLQVQAIYSDEELEELRAQITDASPGEVIGILQAIEENRGALRRLRRSADWERRSALELGARHARQRTAALEEANAKLGERAVDAAIGVAIGVR